MDDRYVYFDYTSVINSTVTRALAIFGWDEKSIIYKYWWFESSASFMTATCNFVNDKTPLLNRHDSLLMQTIDLAKKIPGTIVAVDIYQPYLDELNKRAIREKIAHIFLRPAGKE